MAGTLFEAVEGSAKEEVSFRWCNWAPWWWFTDISFVFGKEALTEGLDKISRFRYSFHLSGDGGE